jgi:heme-degrading monooxygenase HmoA
MFVRVSRGSLPADRIDQGIANFQQTTLPSLATQPGFLGGLVMVDRSTGAVRAMSYWEDEAAMRGSEAMAAETRAQAAQEIGAQVSEPERYELVVSERVVAPHPNVFVRVNDVHGSIEHIDDLLDFARQQVLAALKTQHGWLALQLMVNRQNGRSLLMSVWDSAASREGSEAAIRLLREQGGMTAGASSVDVSLYEAAVVELDAAAFPVGASAKAPA